MLHCIRSIQTQVTTHLSEYLERMHTSRYQPYLVMSTLHLYGRVFHGGGRHTEICYIYSDRYNMSLYVDLLRERRGYTGAIYL